LSQLDYLGVRPCGCITAWLSDDHVTKAEVRDAARMVRAGWDQIPDRWQTLIARDVRYELALAGYSRRLVGDKCDHETWTDLLAWIESRPATASAPQQRAEGDDRKGPS
jgi:hypothetical protein